MNIIDLKEIMLKTASNTMQKEGEEAFKKGLVTYFKGKKLEHIYHIYGKVKDENKLKELNTHIKLHLKKNKLEEVECSCDEFREFSASGYTFMCNHITATSYKFISLLSKDKSEIGKKSNEIKKDTVRKSLAKGDYRLVRKIEKDTMYYEAQLLTGGDKLIIKQEDLKAFLDNIHSRKVRFKFDYIEITAPIFKENLPITFTLKEEKRCIVLTTHKQLPIPLNSHNNVYFFKNEIYLPSKNQIEKYIPLYEKLKVNGEIFYKRDINNYNKLVYFLSSISKSINISESLRNFAVEMVRPEFHMYEEKETIFCDVYLNYCGRKVNILKDNKSSLIWDSKNEEKLIMSLEKYGLARIENRFIFTGGQEELLSILSRRGENLQAIGKVTFCKGLKDMKVYSLDSIRMDLEAINGYFQFAYSIENTGNDELGRAFSSYKAKNKFFRTKEKCFIDFEDDNIKNFFKLFEVLSISENIHDGKVRLPKSKALFLYENMKNRGYKFIKDCHELEEIEKKLKTISTSNIAVPEGFNGKLREYQLQGFKWLKTIQELGFGGILADEMGLGKTIQTIAFILSEKNKKTIIVCPTSLIYNWQDELKRFAPEIRVLIVHGTERTETMKSLCDYDIILTTYGTLRLDIDFYSNIEFDFAIIDEGQNIKNAEALNTKVVKEIKAGTRLALTGTPIENNLVELWSIFDFIMPGYLYSREKFEEKFIQDNEDNLESLKLLIKPFILRRTKKEVMKELPDKVEKKLLVEMADSQKAVYSSYTKKAKALLKTGGEGRMEVFSYLTKLRQICLDPSLIIEDYKGESSKFKTALEIVKAHIKSDGKVILFSQFASVLDNIGQRLKEESIQYYQLDGRTKPKERIIRVKEFNNSDSVKVFLISLKAGGIGLNLTSANLVIHFDPWWNPAVEDQATDRAHRIGQSQVVEVVKLVAKGTIEEKIILLQEEKKELIRNILTGELKNGSLMGAISREDLLKLFDRD